MGTRIASAEIKLQVQYRHAEVDACRNLAAIDDPSSCLSPQHIRVL
jgi:hypothetical protein